MTKKNLWKTLGVFALGLAIGLPLGAWCGHYFMVKRWSQDPSRHIFKYLDRHLKMTAEQKAKVETILEATEVKMMKLRAEGQPRFETIKKDTENKLRAVLTPDQQKKLDQLKARWDRRHPAGPMPLGVFGGPRPTRGCPPMCTPPLPSAMK